tara:strand:- start:1904 stop:2179 length:276 start_codon:yes stop_codon:yes gene_type:complete
MTDHECTIDIYPASLCIEDVPAVFALDDEPADWAVGFAGGTWATLEYITLGGKSLPREDVILMIGCKALSVIEAEISEVARNQSAQRIAAE